jgi:hypothetical protein
MATTCIWSGASGAKYTFHVYPRHPVINAGTMGNYIYTKVDTDNTWKPIYIGQGDLSVRATRDHHQISCIDSKGATHIHIKATPEGEVTRKAQERDLLNAYPQAYAPTGCNRREGG